VFGAYDTAVACVEAATGLLRHIRFRPERLRAALTVDLLATDAADRLVEQGVPFRAAHAEVAASRSWDHPEAAPDAAVKDSLQRRDRPMGPGPASVRRQIAALRAVVGRPLQ
jgi:argininosuccinate lyase